MSSITPMFQANQQHLRTGAALLVRAVLPLLIFGLLETAGLGAGTALARSDSASLTRYQLLPDVTALLDQDGTWQIQQPGRDEPLLTIRMTGLLDGPRGRRRAQPLEYLTDLLHERSAGGARGFSADADDDQDGLVDEDRRDGLDNDGDGLVDEDFAAVSDNMALVQRQHGGRLVHQESYYWPLPGLRSTFFLNLDTDLPDGATLELDGPVGNWLATRVITYEHQATGKSVSEVLQPFVMRVPAGEATEDGPASWFWLGALVLDGPAGWRALEEGSDGRLQIPFTRQPLVLAVVVAPSWPRLSQQLSMARRVHAGVADPVSGRQARWIVPASCSLCRAASAPAAALRVADDGRLVVSLAFEKGASGLVDCDRLSLGGVPLGVPSALRWRPRQGVAVDLDWQEVTPRTLRNRGGFAGHPFVRMDQRVGSDGPAFGGADGVPAWHGSPGTLDLYFAEAREAVAGNVGSLSGFWLDGRAFQSRIQAPGPVTFEPVAVVRPEAEPSEVADSALVDPADPEATGRKLRQAEHAPTLAPELLEGWPNPFRDVIQVRFKVPQTVGEAFVWVEEDDAPADLDKEAAAPWQGSGAGCTVKIYNINGQELVTLYDGTVISGEVTVNWNGTDNFGRQVASGTYFCKLQLDDWSVTRSIVYLR